MEEQNEVLDPVQAEPATALALYDPIESGLAELRTAGAEAFDVKSTAGNKAAREFIQHCVAIRTATEEAYTNWNRPIMAVQKQAREKRDEILGAVKAIEAPVKDQIDAEQKRKDEERTAKMKAEADRIKVHQACLNAIATLPRDYISSPAADVEAAIRDLESPEYLDSRNWEEYAEQAAAAIDAALTTLRAHLENAKAREELAAMRAQQQAEADARRAEQEAAEAERRRVDGIKERIRAIEQAPSTCIGLAARQIQARIDSLAREAADDFAEFQAEAAAAIDAALTNLQTLLAAAKDAEELKQLRDDAAARKRQEEEAKEAAARAEREAEERRQADARAAEEQRKRDEAEAIRREQEAAKAAAERVRAQAGTLLALLTEARAHVPAGDLADRIDAAIAQATGSAA
ncbi:hypothetical protein BKK79_00775 [Cupriavidus sp. USMAA2-4]|uniref:hypothetical protein n=1 Tax=Cupriavidus sp. USMAA2-4 TaxID=876364 RepID=UPI0008A6D671|nr:hypothetical protein [Cupriavidus sp. USMAA2-4]AOY90522.1 hypothetical protein BKK79_00775 [Cupriavidus sp. USMAA2-4]